MKTLALFILLPISVSGGLPTDAFAEEYMASFPVEIGDPGTLDDGQEWTGYSEEGEKEIMDRLEGLGYLG